MVAALPFTKPQCTPRAWDGRDSRPSLAPLAVVVVCLTFLFSYLAGYKAGRSDESRTQLGYLLVAAPRLEELTGAIRSADSISMEMAIQLGRLKRGRGGR